MFHPDGEERGDAEGPVRWRRAPGATRWSAHAADRHAVYAPHCAHATTTAAGRCPRDNDCSHNEQQPGENGGKRMKSANCEVLQRHASGAGLPPTAIVVRRLAIWFVLLGAIAVTPTTARAMACPGTMIATSLSPISPGSAVEYRILRPSTENRALGESFAKGVPGGRGNNRRGWPPGPHHIVPCHPDDICLARINYSPVGL